MDNLNEIKKFEDYIDNELEKLSIFKYDYEFVINTIGTTIEFNYAKIKNPFFYEHGLIILLPILLENHTESDKIPEIDDLLKDLEFACHYYSIRDLFYYTYNVPNSVEWTFDDDSIKIKIKDKTILRHKYIKFNSWIQNSNKIFENYKKDKKIRNLLKNTKEFEFENKKTQKALKLIEKEIILKFSDYYRFIDISSAINLNKYNYKNFYDIYKKIMEQALYDRYYQEANQVNLYIVFYEESEFIDKLHLILNIPKPSIKAVLLDLSYHIDQDVKDPSLFPMIYFKEKRKFMLMPSSMLLSNCFINILRIWGKRNPKLFSEQFSQQLDENFTNYISKLFSENGFFVKKRLELKKYDSSLPDIDLIVISKEPTLGFHIFFCELKNNIPANWSKYELKAVGNKGYIKKALQQTKKIKGFLDTKSGILLINNMIQTEFSNISNDFPSGYMILFNFLIISSQNTGMFFQGFETTIIDYKNLENIVNNSDGDVNYILSALKFLFKESEKLSNKTEVTCNIGKRNVNYEVISPKGILKFEQNIYKSKGYDKKIAKWGKKVNYSFINEINDDFLDKYSKEGKNIKMIISEDDRKMKKKKN